TDGAVRENGTTLGDSRGDELGIGDAGDGEGVGNRTVELVCPAPDRAVAPQSTGVGAASRDHDDVGQTGYSERGPVVLELAPPTTDDAVEVERASVIVAGGEHLEPAETHHRSGLRSVSVLLAGAELTVAV